MTRLEMVEQIREKTGVSYDVAKDVLERCDWDMLDAIIALDKPDFTAAREKSAEENMSGRHSGKKASETFSDVGTKALNLIRFALRMIARGEDMRMEIYRKEELIGSISVTALVLLFLLIWWIPVVLIAAGMFTGFRFHFTGAGRLVNTIAEKTGEKAEELKNKINE